MMFPGTSTLILELFVTLCVFMTTVESDRKRLSNPKGFITNAHFGRRKTTTTATVTTTTSTDRQTTQVSNNITTSSDTSSLAESIQIQSTSSLVNTTLRQNTSFETIESQNITVNNSLEGEWKPLSNLSITHTKIDNYGNSTVFENSTNVENIRRTIVDVFDKKKFLESFKKHILMKLGLNEEDLTDTLDQLPALPPEHDWLEMISDQPKGNHMNTIAAVPKKVTLMATDISTECAGLVNIGCVEFTKMKDTGHRRVRSAMLWCHFNTSLLNISVSLSTLKKKDGGLSEIKEISSKKMKEANKKWLGFDVKDVINTWLSKSKSLQGFGIKCINCSEDISKSLQFVDGYKPVMIFQPKTKRSQIKDRNTGCVEGQSTCCMKYFEVDSADVLNIIRFPPRISLNYCTGSCNDPTLANTNHTVMIQNYRWHEQTKLNSSFLHKIGPCCAPIAYSDRSVFIQNGVSDFTEYVIPNLSVTACGCI